MRPIAFFDFDGTITSHDTFISFGRMALGNTRFVASLIKASPWLIFWKLGFINNSRAKERLFGFMFKGMKSSTFHILGQSFTDNIDNDLRSETMRLIARHKALKHHICIVSASIEDWIRPWADKNGIDDVIATKVEVDENGYLTGRFLTPNCHGKTKVDRIISVFGELKDSETYAYGDSEGDNAMLAFAKHSQML